MDGRTGLGSNNKRKHIKSYKTQKDVESHDRIYPEEICHIKEYVPYTYGHVPNLAK